MLKMHLAVSKLKSKIYFPFQMQCLLFKNGFTVMYM